MKVNRLDAVQTALFDCNNDCVVIKTKEDAVYKKMRNQLLSMAKKEGYSVSLNLLKEKKQHAKPIDVKNLCNGGKPTLHLV